jgi:mRNA-degrading endonuclease RelE of RelBE toxin-antitoxin system
METVKSTNEYHVSYTKKFTKDIEHYRKKKKYRHIENDISPVIEELEKGNLIGDVIPELFFNENEHTVKVRAVNTDTRSSKRDGYRIIYYAIKDDKEIFLLSIYYKKDDSRVLTNKQIAELVKEYCL